MTSSDAVSRGGRFMEANGVTFYYEVHGQGEPLLLLHAGSLTAEMWRPYLAGFSDRYLLVIPDLPNHGRSSRPARPLSYRRMADEIVGFMQALHLTSPAIIGFSDGGQVALEIGVRYPALSRAIAMGGVVFRDSDASRAFVRDALGDPESPDVDPAHLARTHPDWAAWLDEIYGQGGWTSLLEQLKPMWTTPLKYTANEFASVAAPVLVFVGDRDELVPVQEAVEMFCQLPNAELAVVPDANHGAFFSTRAGAFQAVLLEFLHRHPT